MTPIYLVGMSGPDSLDNLKALIEPIKSFISGIVWTLHDSRDSAEATYLESVKGKGKVVHYHYSSRHDASRNQYLWCGPLKPGDWCVQIDDGELLCPTFAARMVEQIERFKAVGVNMAYYYGKPFLFEYHESLRYQGSPHEGLFREDGAARAIELKDSYPNENDVRLNMRPFRRTDPFGWVDHYAKYYVTPPWGSNHCLLGNEARETTERSKMQIYQQREALRLLVRDEMRSLGYSLNLQGLWAYLQERYVKHRKAAELHSGFLFGGPETPLSPLLVRALNEEKIIQDYYRYHLLNDKTVIDDHKWPGMKSYE